MMQLESKTLICMAAAIAAAITATPSTASAQAGPASQQVILKWTPTTNATTAARIMGDMQARVGVSMQSS